MQVSTSTLEIREGESAGVVQVTPSLPPNYLCQTSTSAKTVVRIHVELVKNNKEFRCRNKDLVKLYGKYEINQAVFSPVDPATAETNPMCGVEVTSAQWAAGKQYPIRIKAKMDGKKGKDKKQKRTAKLKLVQYVDGTEVCSYELSTIQV